MPPAGCARSSSSRDFSDRIAARPATSSRMACPISRFRAAPEGSARLFSTSDPWMSSASRSIAGRLNDSGLGSIVTRRAKDSASIRAIAWRRVRPSTTCGQPTGGVRRIDSGDSDQRDLLGHRSWSFRLRRPGPPGSPARQPGCPAPAERQPRIRSARPVPALARCRAASACRHPGTFSTSAVR